jgi:hypothetical protein
MGRDIPQATTTKIITALDIAATLMVEHIGITFQLPFYHPVIIGSVAGATYTLIRHGNTISTHVLNVSDFARGAVRKTLFFEN